MSWGEAKDGVLEGPKSVETEGAIGGAGVEDDEGQEPALDHWGAEGGEFGDEVTDGGHDGSFDGEFSLEGLLAVGEARAVEPVVSVQDGVWVGGKKFVDAVEDVYGGEGGAEEGDAAGEGSEEVAGGDFYFAEVEGLKRDWELGFCEHEVEEEGGYRWRRHFRGGSLNGGRWLRGRGGLQRGEERRTSLSSLQI